MNALIFQTPVAYQVAQLLGALESLVSSALYPYAIPLILILTALVLASASSWFFPEKLRGVAFLGMLAVFLAIFFGFLSVVSP